MLPDAFRDKINPSTPPAPKGEHQRTDLTLLLNLKRLKSRGSKGNNLKVRPAFGCDGFFLSEPGFGRIEWIKKKNLNITT
jgi:hypothetical protein